MGDAESRHLLVVGAYRDTEVGPAHPLASSLTGLREAGTQVREVHLGAISRDDVAQLIADALNQELATARPLADLVVRKTAGNPFFVRRLAWLHEKLGVLNRQGERMERLVNEMLDISRIARGRLRLELELVDLSEVVREVVGRFEEGGELARFGSKVTADVGEKIVGRWDRFRIEQVVTNLVSNALKYGEGRPVDVTVSSDGSTATLVVTDHGIGIQPEHLQRIFGRFERAVSSRHYGGFGLGLYIANQIVEAMAGSIDVRSTPGQGSTFKVHARFPGFTG